MQKQAPSVGRIMVAVGFALSCFSLLLFLWVTFGGPVPFAAQSYRFTADFPEAALLAKESEVRTAGVNIGKVKKIELAPEDAPDPNTTRATIELDSEFAPLPKDAKAILRQKTLLGETFVEITRGSKQPTGEAAEGSSATEPVDDESATIPEGGHLDNAQVQEQTQIDEIFNALDPETRKAFQDWQQEIAVIVQSRGEDFNYALGNLGPFVTDASDVLETLNRQDRALNSLVRDTGETFAALTERDQELAGVITNSNDTFRALANRDQALAETFSIFPTFLDESKATLARLDTFALDTRPLINDLKPVADDLAPTLRSVRRLSPDLIDLFRGLDPLITASKKGLPDLRKFLRGLRPLLAQLDPFLANLNPVIRYLAYNKETVSDFLAGPPAALTGTLSSTSVTDPQSTRHVLRQVSYSSAETLSVQAQRLASNRGNGYLQPFAIGNQRSNEFGEVFPSFDCRNAGGERRANTGSPAQPACTVQGKFPGEFGGKQAPNIGRDK